MNLIDTNILRTCKRVTTAYILTTDILILSVTGGILPYRVICVGFIRDKSTSIVHLLCSEESNFSAVQNSNLDSLADNH